MNFNVNENQKALCLFIAFFVVMGCAGQGDYEYAKSKEVTHEKMCK
jgi:hypothetical protein